MSTKSNAKKPARKVSKPLRGRKTLASAASTWKITKGGKGRK